MAIKKLASDQVGLPDFPPVAPADGDVFSLSSHRRARQALEFGLSVSSPGFNIFVVGADRSGRMTATLGFLEKAVAERPSPPDWLYLNNFREPHLPKPYALPAGQGRRFKAAMETLLPQLGESLTKAFGASEFAKQVEAQNDRVQQQLAEQIEVLRDELRGQGMDLLQNPQGMSIIATDEQGQPVPSEALTAERRDKLETLAKGVNEKLRDLKRYAAQQQMQLAENLQDMTRQVAENAVGGLMEEVEARFSDHPEITAWLEEMRQDLLENIGLFHPRPDGSPHPPGAAPEQRYAVNLLVDRTEDPYPNVELEPNPTFERLFGYVEYRQAGGILETDFSMIRTGSLHRANGGILVLRAESLAVMPGIWPALKAALRDREIEITTQAHQAALPIAGAPKPTPIPLDVKVVLVGSPRWYYTFFSVDPDFQALFRIKADVDTDLEASDGNRAHYAGLIEKMADDYGKLTVEPDAVQRLLAMAARWSGDRRRLTAQFERVEDCLREAAHLLDPPCKGSVTRVAVEAAITARRERNARVEDRLHEQIAEGTMMIDVAGEVIGQVNALTVRDTGDHAFGTPSRVTARASVGRRGVINVERDIALGGPIQQKGAMVIQGFLAGHFARRYPLSFNCSITFEQSYGGVEGDSASLAELVAILSELSRLPVRQDLAITGSVNQRGDSQAVGGVHHKIEGFFRTCSDRAPLTGTQGVAIPRANEASLVLRGAVAEAVAADSFHIWSVDTVDEAVELFLGRPTGAPDAKGDYPPESVYGLVAAELQRFDAILRGRREDAAED